MFDTNIFNQILDDGVNFPNLPELANYYVTHIQIDEINNTKDKSRRSSLLRVFQDISNKKIPTTSAVFDISKFDESNFSSEDEAVKLTESVVLGVSRLGMAKLGDGELYNLLVKELDSEKPKEHENNIKDALIAETSIKNKFILVTNDKALHKIVRKKGCNALNWDEFINNK